jgi:DNA-binding FadR family transcriptional regulator
VAQSGAAELCSDGERIAAAVLAGDVEAADQAMREHTSLSDGSFLDVIATIARGHEK